jgi:hypothetical protein
MDILYPDRKVQNEDKIMEIDLLYFKKLLPVILNLLIHFSLSLSSF